MSSNPGNNGLPIPGSSGQLPPSSLTSAQPRTTASARPLSCALCQRRKIKCDRTVPCSNCIKANIVCTPSKPAPPRQRMRPRQDLQERLARCEGLLRQYADAERPVPGELFSPKPTTASGASTPSTSGGGLSVKTYPQPPAAQGAQGVKRSPASTTPTGGRIVQESSITGAGSGARFVDGQLWEKLNDEISNMKKLIESEDSDYVIPPYDHQKEFEDTSNCPSPGSDEKPVVDPVQAFKLWQIFLDRVNPMIKIIHAPTLQPYLVQAAADISTVPLDYQALLYSIFGMASMTLADAEAVSILGIPKEKAGHNFTRGIFQALSRFDFLRRYNMVVTQALVHALIILQNNYNRHASWVLSGSLVRIAISMGYHRDGEGLKLPPFETEMRRRIWWQIVTYDLKLTVDCGFKHQSITTDFDTKRPLNLNDADMYPDASGELKPREGPTEMAFILVSNRLTLYMLDEESRLTVESTILGQGTPETPLDPDVMERNRLLVQQLEQDLIDIERRFLNPTAGNAHLAALGLRPHLINRLNDMMQPMTEAADWGTEVFGPKDNLFKLLLCTSENIGDAYMHMKEWGFGWYIRLHFHLEIMASLSSFMYQRPVCDFSDRSWRVFESLYREFPEISNLTQRAHLTQAQFTLKAWDAREQAYHNSGSLLQVPEFILHLRQMVQQHATPSASGAAKGGMVGGQGDVPMSTDMQTPTLSFGLEEQMGSNSLHSSFLTWDFLGNMSEMGGMGDVNDSFGGPFEQGGGHDRFQ